MPDIKKIKIGATIYDIKDQSARDSIAALTGGIDKLGTAAAKDFVEAVTADGTNLPTSKAVVDYVKANLDKINQFEYEIVASKEALPTPSADTMYKIYLVPLTGTHSAGDAYEEYITIKSGETYSMEKLGDTNIDLTGYVPTGRTIAGIALSDNITAEALKTALKLTDADLNLGALAHKDSASATLTDYATGVASVTYTPEVTVSAADAGNAATPISSTGKFTPAGSISTEYTPAGTASFAKDNANGVEITGTVSAPDVTVSLTKATVLGSVKSAGTLPSKAADIFSAGSATTETGKFATEGVTATVGAAGTDDAETLVFAVAGTADALNKLNYVAPSYTEGAFSAGAMPTFENAEVANGVESATATAPTFSGDKYAASFTGTKATISANLVGAEGDVTVSGSYDKFTLGELTATGKEATIAPTLQTGSKTITVK